MEVELDAPVMAASEAEIAAAPEAVWDVIADFASWPEWNPDVRQVKVEGPVEPGTSFRWRAGPTIRSTLQEVDRPHQLAWIGKTFGVNAVHVWSFQRCGDKTLARTAESWTGFLPRLLPRSMKKTLQKSLDQALPNLALEVERRAATTTR